MSNDYSELQCTVEMCDPSIAAESKVSVVVPTFNRAEKLSKTLAAITHQHHPLEHIEVVIADDGSTDDTWNVVRSYENRINLTHVRRADRGHRLAEICNLGIRTAQHDNIVLLQCDMLPHPDLIRSYARWLSTCHDVLLIGMRHFTCSDNLSAESLCADSNFSTRLPIIETKNQIWHEHPIRRTGDWRYELYRKTDWLKRERWPFRAVVGSNLAFRKSLVTRIGGFCEDFRNWGGEDGEFGYRAYNAGFFLVPIPDAIAYHQEPPNGENETDRLKGFSITSSLREQKCALPPFRKARSNHGTDYDVPKVSVCIIGSQSDAISNQLRTLEDDSYSDLEILIVGLDGCNALPSGIDEHTARRSRWFSASSATAGQALYHAASASNGAYLFFLDSRVTLRTGEISSLAKTLDDEDIGCIFVCFESNVQMLMVRRQIWSRLGELPAHLDGLADARLIIALRRFCVVRETELMAHDFSLRRMDTESQC